MNQHANVTVVLCTYNRAAMLEDAMRSLIQLRTAGRFQYELLVVDNGSTDETAAVVERIGNESRVPVRLVKEPRPGVAYARNRGIEEATGEWVAFSDDDQIADPDWLFQLWDVAGDHDVQCVGGAVRLQLPESDVAHSDVCRMMFGESDVGGEPRPYQGRMTPGAGNLLLHRVVLQSVGVFDARQSEAGEDTDLFRRIRAAGIEAWFAPKAVVCHRIPEYRLKADYLRWSSERIGWCFSVRDLRKAGRSGLAVRTVARIGQSLVWHLPRLVGALVSRDGSARIGLKCLLWRTNGYVRGALHGLASSLFPQMSFRERLAFRTERCQFANEPVRCES